MDLEKISKVLIACLKDAQIFERDVQGSSLIEVDTVNFNNKKWLVAAAGISTEQADEHFNNPARKNRATIPINLIGGGQASLFFVLRKVELQQLETHMVENVATFAPGENIHFVEIREGFFRVSNLPDNNANISSLRIEFDNSHTNKNPIEPWLNKWMTIVGVNPAHPFGHLHINSPPLEPGESRRSGSVESEIELRLCVGTINPLLLILSFASWLKRQ